MGFWSWLREHWKGLLVLLGSFVALQLWAPVAWAGAALVLAAFVGIPLIETYAENRLRKYVQRHIENLGHEVVEIKRWRTHFGVIFRAHGTKHYLRFEHGRWGRVVDWVDGPPEHVVSGMNTPRDGN